MKISKRLLESLILKMLKETAENTQPNDKLPVEDIFFKDEVNQNKEKTTK